MQPLCDFVIAAGDIRHRGAAARRRGGAGGGTCHPRHASGREALGGYLLSPAGLLTGGTARGSPTQRRRCECDRRCDRRCDHRCDLRCDHQYAHQCDDQYNHQTRRREWGAARRDGSATPAAAMEAGGSAQRLPGRILAAGALAGGGSRLPGHMHAQHEHDASAKWVRSTRRWGSPVVAGTAQRAHEIPGTAATLLGNIQEILSGSALSGPPASARCGGSAAGSSPAAAAAEAALRANPPSSPPTEVRGVRVETTVAARHPPPLFKGNQEMVMWWVDSMDMRRSPSLWRPSQTSSCVARAHEGFPKPAPPAYFTPATNGIVTVRCGRGPGAVRGGAEVGRVEVARLPPAAPAHRDPRLPITGAVPASV
eukprot:gene4497-biopygen609